MDNFDIVRAAILLITLVAGAAYLSWKLWGLVRGTLPLLLVLGAVAGGVEAAEAVQSLGARDDRPGQIGTPSRGGGSGRFGFACKSPWPRHGSRPKWQRGIRVCQV